MEKNLNPMYDWKGRVPRYPPVIAQRHSTRLLSPPLQDNSTVAPRAPAENTAVDIPGHQLPSRLNQTDRSCCFRDILPTEETQTKVPGTDQSQNTTQTLPPCGQNKQQALWKVPCEQIYHPAVLGLTPVLVSGVRWSHPHVPERRRWSIKHSPPFLTTCASMQPMFPICWRTFHPIKHM